MDIVNSPEFANQPPDQIIPILADRDQFIASESTVYRLLREKNQLTHRGKAKQATCKRPEPLQGATLQTSYGVGISPTWPPRYWFSLIGDSIISIGYGVFRESMILNVSDCFNRYNFGIRLFFTYSTEPVPAGTTKYENKIVLGIHFQFNLLGSEATSLFDVRRWAFDVGRSFSYKVPLLIPASL